MFPEDEEDFDARIREERYEDEEEINISLIEAYQQINANAEIVQLAAMMAPKADQFNPASLIDQAFLLQAEVNAGALRSRKALAESMNLETLIVLIIEFKVRNLPPEIYMHPQFTDPIIGPALQEFQKRNPIKRNQKAKNFIINNTLKTADNRTSLPRPSLPCSLEDALRYIADAPNTPWKALEKAYNASPKFIPRAEVLDFYPVTLDVIMENLNETGEAITLSNSPDNTDLNNQVLRINTKRELAKITDYFYPYWKKHGPSFESEINLFKEKGATGAEKRDRELWITRIDSFITSKHFKKFLQSEKRLQSQPSYEAAVDDFLKSFNEQGTKSHQAKKKTRKFLVSLFTHKDKSMTTSTIKGFNTILGNSGIVAISSDTILACHEKLKSILDGTSSPS